MMLVLGHSIVIVPSSSGALGLATRGLWLAHGRVLGRAIGLSC